MSSPSFLHLEPTRQSGSIGSCCGTFQGSAFWQGEPENKDSSHVTLWLFSLEAALREQV